MPRDFVPCLYSEQVLEDAVSQVSYKRCQAIEGFLMADRVTQEPYVTLTGDSHAHFIDTDHDDTRARDHLFGIFYAAMADLED